MRPIALAIFKQVANSPAAVINGTHELIVEGVREKKLTTRAHRAALDMARIRKLSAGDSLVERLLLSAACAITRL
eukprot:1185557-Pleurochrysis_carterae.AAC.3